MHTFLAIPAFFGQPRGNKGDKMSEIDIKFDKRNYRQHGARNKKLINKSLRDCGAARSIVIDADNSIIAGNGVYAEWTNLHGERPPIRVVETDGREMVVVKRTDIAADSKERQQLAVMDNSTSDLSEFDYELMQQDMDDATLEDYGIDMNPVVDKSPVKELPRGNLADDFLIIPTSILNARDAKWQARKRAWLDVLNIGAGGTREGLLGFSDLNTDKYGKRKLLNISIFDCVLAELMYKWFTPTDPAQPINAFDPFAGDICKGGVFAYLGANFKGIELRPEQIDQNAKDLDGKDWADRCQYVQDSGENVAAHFEPNTQDFMFSCPPYFDLEKYSDDPRDASNQSYDGFLKILQSAFTACASALKNNRFAVIVMSNVRNHKNGGYYDICGDICRIMQDAGMILYNEFILVNPIGTGAIRTRGNMKSRKNVRTHQEVLVFYKGDNPLKEIPAEFGKIAFAEMDQEEESADEK